MTLDVVVLSLTTTSQTMFNLMFAGLFISLSGTLMVTVGWFVDPCVLGCYE